MGGFVSHLVGTFFLRALKKLLKDSLTALVLTLIITTPPEPSNLMTGECPGKFVRRMSLLSCRESTPGHYLAPSHRTCLQRHHRAVVVPRPVVVVAVLALTNQRGAPGSRDPLSANHSSPA